MALHVLNQDITKVNTDAIVNAANPLLIRGGGVDGCIHKAAGVELQKECFRLHGCMFGNAKITKGYNLPCKYVIHAVGPVWLGGLFGEERILKSCYVNSLALAEEYDCRSIAFPLISTGIFGYPVKKASEIAVNVLGEYVVEKDIDIYITVIDNDIYNIVENFLADE